ncbi:hypothetical protein OG824_25005 [Streptomyces prunicolor]|uniref:hypothetical protein n=1 Tax=Streptomyces prunicolor TaxID=67348 RepID=UPI002256A93A|nr:hypothetical protein [Streptomyces prunicolor]MCX5238460.1 hypothetical protein [Streptomyces prunicolor]
MSALDWVNTGASVFTALGTVGAFAVGGVVLYRDRKATAEQRQEAATRAEMERRRQASFVTAWGVSTDSEHYDRSGPNFAVGQPPKIQYTVLNNSDGPISDVVLYVPVPTGRETGPRGNLNVGFLAPQSERRVKEPSSHDLRLQFSVPSPIPIFFTDTQGIVWFRDGQGALYEWSDDIDARLSKPLAIVEPEAAPGGLPGGAAGSRGI